MPVKMFWAGKRMEEVAPLEITVMWTNARGGGFCGAFLTEAGTWAPMIPDFDEESVCVFGTQYAARVMVLNYAMKYIEQGMQVVYRSDAETVRPFAVAA